MRAKVLKVAAIVGAATIAGSVTASVAVADAPSSCANTYYCVYYHDDFQGAMYTDQQSDPGGWDSMNDQGSSLGNNKNNLVRFYENSSYEGWNVCLSNNSKDADLPSDRNDEITSAKVGNSAYC